MSFRCIIWQMLYPVKYCEMSHYKATEIGVKFCRNHANKKPTFCCNTGRESREREREMSQKRTWNEMQRECSGFVIKQTFLKLTPKHWLMADLTITTSKCSSGDHSNGTITRRYRRLVVRATGPSLSRLNDVTNLKTHNREFSFRT